MSTRLHATCVNLSAIALLVSLSPSFAFAGADTGRPEDMEEVRVLGARAKLDELRAEIIRTETEFYEQLNKLLADPEMHVTCRVEPPTGSLVNRRVCEPRFIATANATYARDMIQSLALGAAAEYGRISTSRPMLPGGTISSNELTFHRDVSGALQKSEKLRELVKRRASLEVLLRAAQKARFARNKVPSHRND